MNTVIPFFVFLFFLHFGLQAQDSSIFKINPWADIAITGGSLITNYVGLSIVNGKRSVDSLTAYSLDPQMVSAFDRGATRQDPNRAVAAESNSDILMNGSLVAPFLLFTDKRIRAEWQEVLLLYAQTQGITGSLYSWGSAIHIDRIRPVAYNPREPIERRTGGSTYNSFYSGHVASSTAATFFMVKVYTSFYPEKFTGKKWLLYGAASIPPALVGLYRYQGGKHFPSDILVGYVIGAMTGILIPEIHLRKTNKQISVLPMAGEHLGLATRIRF